MVERKGKGTFRVTKSGGIEYRVSYYDINGTRRVKSFTANEREECIRRADDFLMRNEMKLIAVKPEASVSEIIRMKIDNDYVKNYCSEAGYDRNLQALARIEGSLIGDVPIKDVTLGLLNDYLEDITSYAQSIVRKQFSLVKMAFEMAASKGVIKTNYFVTKNIKCPRSKKPEKKVRAMTVDEQKRFVDTLLSHKVPYGRNTYKHQLLIELYTGMRMGEINALKPSNINFKKGYIHVCATISRGIGGKSYYKRHPKTDKSIRDVPISKLAEVVLREAIGDMVENPEGLIFYDCNKEDVVSTYQVGTFFKRICEKADVPYHGQHALRHTFATRAIEANVPAVVLQRWLGHTNIHITLDRYTDVFERMNNSAITKYDNYIDKVKEDDFYYVA